MNRTYQRYEPSIYPKRTLEPYEYDEYYNTRVNRPWAKSFVPIILGILLFLLGAGAIAASIVDLWAGATINPFTHNPNWIGQIDPGDNVNLAGSWSENSIWPTIGKGIWVGLLLVATGLLGLVSRYDGSRIGVYIFNILAWSCVIFSLYLILSAILSVEVYPHNGLYTTAQRTTPQNYEFFSNVALLVIGFISMCISLYSAIFSCIYLDYCSKVGRSFPKYSKYGEVQFRNY